MAKHLRKVTLNEGEVPPWFYPEPYCHTCGFFGEPLLAVPSRDKHLIDHPGHRVMDLYVKGSVVRT
jgi:hypothetical protein